MKISGCKKTVCVDEISFSIASKKEYIDILLELFIQEFLENIFGEKGKKTWKKYHFELNLELWIYTDF